MSGKRDGTAKSDVSKNVDAFHTRCHEMGLKITPQRTAVYKALLETDEHPSAEAVFRQVRCYVIRWPVGPCLLKVSP